MAVETKQEGPARGFGVVGALPHEIVRVIAPAAERAGYATFWVNDTPTGDGLAALRVAADATDAIRLGVGVIPLDRQPAARIADRVAELGLPTERLVVGVGSGNPVGGLARVRAEVPALEAAGVKVVVGALGPRMCALAGELADGVLLNWLTPEWVGPSAATTLRAAAEAGRPRPEIATYVRAALGTAATERLRREAGQYASYPAYAANFARMGATALDTSVFGDAPEAVRAGLARYGDALDEVVVRAITAEESAEAYLALLEAASPMG